MISLFPSISTIDLEGFLDSSAPSLDLCNFFGGIITGLDAFEYILCGASAVQIGTIFYKEGVECFERISNELINIMKDKKYTNLESFRGKLKICNTYL